VVLQAGVIEQVGTPLDLYHHPHNLFVAGFIGSPKMNFLSGTVTGSKDGALSVRLAGGDAIDVPVVPGHASEGAPVTLGVRPEDFTVGEGGLLRGEVLVVERLGGSTFLHVKTGSGDLLTVQADGDSPVRMHDRIGLRVNPGDCHLFDQAGLAIPRTSRHPLAGEKPASTGRRVD
jgi:multiple sugar transport system ATP-binding protein